MELGHKLRGKIAGGSMKNEYIKITQCIADE